MNVPVIGNGVTLGLVDSHNINGGMTIDAPVGLSTFQNYYGTNISGNDTMVGIGGLTPGALGVTTDPTKSGLITKFSGLTLGTVPSEKLGSFYIRY